ncbi:hypothetical protein [Bradyrhizobium sp.]|jgi:hypothetical protein|uniref:hypothetical protein n=1 Tax=Bradyrhizobium sp. TaxID=376 RepID=UPI002DFD8512|nr:hypothetical protein [Bradyrhizobium sp.]
MPLLRSAIATGLLIIGLHVLVAAVATEAVAANECPCLRTGSACVRDDACEARKRQRWRRAYQRPTVGTDPVARRSGSGGQGSQGSQGYQGFRRAAPASDSGASPKIIVRPAQNTTSSAPPARGPRGTLPTARARPRILETGYSPLAELGSEAAGYGLYSYAILPSDSRRAARFLGEVFKEIPAIGDTSAQLSQLNIFYIPLRKDKQADFTAMRQAPGRDAAKLGAETTKSFYDYRMARALLNHVCNPPDRSVLDLCNGDLSRGPYIFTYASPASSIEPVPPPFLFVDLSDVHERAFGEMLAAFQSQVKQEDITDQAKMHTMRLNILQVALTAADWVSPVQKAVADIVRSATGGDDKKDDKK